MTAVPLSTVEAAVLRRIAEAEQVFCFLDYDGTLSRLAPTPYAATPLAGIETVLRELASVPATQVALVTGRTIGDLRRLLDVPGTYYIGIHGLEIRVPNGVVERPERAGTVRAVLPAIKRRIEHALGHRPGILIEDKGLALACHYRLATRADAAHARDVVVAIATQYQRSGAPIVVMHGHEVVEVRSMFANKGKAVCHLLATYAPAALAIYVGDDQTDEDAFRLLPPGSITLRVGAGTVWTAARYRVEDPAEVLFFLRAIVARRRQLEPVVAQMAGG